MADSENSLPLPSHIHYELLLQLLERETMAAIYQNRELREEVNELIIILRKALSQQRQIEELCQQKKQPIDYRWSLNNYPPYTPTSKNSP